MYMYIHGIIGLCTLDRFVHKVIKVVTVKSSVTRLYNSQDCMDGNVLHSILNGIGPTPFAIGFTLMWDWDRHNGFDVGLGQTQWL